MLEIRYNKAEIKVFMENGPADILQFQIERKILNISKNFLSIIEDLIDEGYIIHKDRYQRIRKRILDGSGEAIRELESTVNKFDIRIKE